MELSRRYEVPGEVIKGPAEEKKKKEETFFFIRSLRMGFC